MNRADSYPKQRVYFGRDHGERTLGEIVKRNPKKAKIRQLESRGRSRSHAIGTIWTVPWSLVTPVSGLRAPVSEPSSLRGTTFVVKRKKTEIPSLTFLGTEEKYAVISLIGLVGAFEREAHPEKGLSEETQDTLRALWRASENQLGVGEVLEADVLSWLREHREELREQFPSFLAPRASGLKHSAWREPYRRDDE